MQEHEIISLLKNFGERKLTDEEQIQLFKWYNSVGADEFHRLLATAGPQKINYPEPSENFLSSLKTRIAEFEANQQGNIYPGNDTDHSLVVPLYKRSWLRYAAAIIIMLGIGAYLWLPRSTEKRETAIYAPKSLPENILPGTNRATLTLADGRVINLDTTANGQLAMQGSSSVVKLNNGELVYTAGAGGEVLASPSSPFEKGGGAERRGISASTNTMSTPRGGQYQLTLSDGTRVWLNAASSITYPATFTENTRTVSITGEAYFEVEKNPKQPFIVEVSLHSPFEKGGGAQRRGISEKGGSGDVRRNVDRRGIYQITVLGTSFNVNAYSDEPSIKTALAEGSVKVNDVILKPGQVYTNGKVTTTNIEQDLAWKNGAFNFDNADIPAVMRQLSRWYDIDIKYEGKLPVRQFKGELSRDLNLTELLRVLKSLNVKFRIEGRALIVEGDKS